MRPLCHIIITIRARLATWQFGNYNFNTRYEMVHEIQDDATLSRDTRAREDYTTAYVPSKEEGGGASGTGRLHQAIIEAIAAESRLFAQFSLRTSAAQCICVLASPSESG